MKKILLGLGLGLTLLGGMSTKSVSNSDSAKEEIAGCRYGQCHATAKSTGRRCRACVSNSGDYYCGWHD